MVGQKETGITLFFYACFRHPWDRGGGSHKATPNSIKLHDMLHPKRRDDTLGFSRIPFYAMHGGFATMTRTSWHLVKPKLWHTA